ncbi:restriction endonuclease [Novosphingobium sp. BL-52-GroH]|uniref:nSTAND3 domain-containing NTPase n=1 Tax=Novosphingobium sp. BL-52-GroH TaxID=3349877 RepID=UPI00384D1D7B
MPYDFTSLLPADFEDLARDLIGKALDVRFEAFGPGPDGGMDGRHTTAEGDIILQAKHYVGSSPPQLLAAMRKERQAIDRLAPARYLLATSRHLSPTAKASLAAAIGPSLKRQDDILGQGDLNSILLNHPEVERAHLKLWLSSTSVLETILDAIANSGSHAFTASSRSEIEAKVKVYAPNPSLPYAREVLERRHVLIVSGPPGVGKTTLAEILTFAYLREGWELIALRSLDDGFARIDDRRKQIFFFDDFLGTISLDQRALSAKDSELTRFMNRVRSSPNARFVLTTRAYILNEARQWSERLADRRVELSTYVLDLSSYTRAIRARILYNHLALGGMPRAHVVALIESGLLPAIIDHRNYSPRIIEWMTDVLRVDEVPPAEYPTAFVEALANPSRLWDRAFRTHITAAARHLLIALFFTGRHGGGVGNLRMIFESFHARMCSDLGLARDPKDFENSLRHVEGGFVAIEDGDVDFINPSVRDYIASYLSDGMLLLAIANSCSSGDSVREIWTFAQKHVDWLDLPDVARALKPALPVLASPGSSTTLDNSDRISLILELWRYSGDDSYAEAALSFVRTPGRDYSPWRDGPRLLALLAELADEGHYQSGPLTTTVATAIEDVMIAMLEEGMGSDDLQRISDTVEDDYGYSNRLRVASHAAIAREFDQLEDTLWNYSSESELEDHAIVLRQLAPRALVPEVIVKQALDAVEERISEVQVRQAKSVDPEFEAPDTPDDETFDDEALGTLFDSLR